MARRPLGCFSGPALAAVALTIFAIVGSARLNGGMLFSPGALSAQSTGIVLGNVGSHAEIGGQCDACHPAPWDSDTMADRCLACHTDVRGQFAQVGSRHAAYAK